MLFPAKRCSFLLVPLLIGCGAAASLPPSSDSSKLSEQVSEAVWYAELGDYPGLVTTGAEVLAEDGEMFPASIFVHAPGDESKYVHGAFRVVVPDHEKVEFRSRLALAADASGSALFQVYVQDGVNFPKLAETAADMDGRLDSMAIDLSKYRGQNILLVLAVSSPDHLPLNTSALWIDPRILAE